MDDIITAARAATARVLIRLGQIIEEKHAKQYLANLFKNAQKCKELQLEEPPVSRQKIALSGPSDATQFGLFDSLD
jgi:hypothetical protein